MQIATWNLNSLNVRLPHLLRWLSKIKPDIVGLQELKCADTKLAEAAIKELGYYAVFSAQKTYNGVGLLSRDPDLLAQHEIVELCDTQKRIIAGTINGIRIVNIYVPNGETVDSKKFFYKLDWLQHLIDWLELELHVYEKLCLIGDYNIAPTQSDVHPNWKKEIHVSFKERAAFAMLQALGLQDVFRKFSQPEKSFSWWHYGADSFRRNLGLRIDHILVTPSLAENCTECVIDKSLRALDRPSDHAPLIATFKV